jgi:hypothetical protein
MKQRYYMHFSSFLPLMHHTEINGLHVTQDADNQGRTPSMQTSASRTGIVQVVRRKVIAVNTHSNLGVHKIWV